MRNFLILQRFLSIFPFSAILNITLNLLHIIALNFDKNSQLFLYFHKIFHVIKILRFILYSFSNLIEKL